MDGTRADQLPREQPRQIPAPPDQADQQRHRSLGPNYSRRSSLPDTLETVCFARDQCPQRSASSNPPAAKNQRCENHMKRGVFTQPGSFAAHRHARDPVVMSALLRKLGCTKKPLEIMLAKCQQNAPFWVPNLAYGK